MKCIASDMDGTLLNEDQKISEENRKALEAVRDMGGQVIIATGRSFKEARLVLDEINFNCPIISMNGAAVYDQKGELITSQPISFEELDSAITFLEEAGLYFELYTNHGVFSKNPERAIDTLVDIVLSANPEHDREDVRRRALARIEYGFLFETQDYHALIKEEDMQVFKILVFSLYKDQLSQAAQGLARFDGLTITSSGKGNIEINHRGISKGNALEKLLSQYGIPLEETIAIGDNLNDVSMFEKAGLSIAMGNARDDIKRICKDTTLSNKEDGVAHAIYRYMVSKK